MGKWLAIALTALAFESAFAQTLTVSEASAGQATVKRDDEGFVSCGVRIVANADRYDHIETYDFSLTLDASFFRGLVKAGKYSVPGSSKAGWDIAKRKVFAPGPTSAWFAPQSSDKTLKLLQTMKAEDAGFILGISDFDTTAETLFAFVAGKPVQMSLRYAKDRLDNVVSVKTDFSETDKAAFFDCMDGLERRIKRELVKLQTEKK